MASFSKLSFLQTAVITGTLAGAMLAGPAPAALAAANLVVSPTRVVAEGNVRGAVVYLSNRGDETGVYRMELVYRRMKEDGSIEEITSPDSQEALAAHLIRFSPREVTLPPGGTQAIRIQVRKPADLPPGEYRVHLHMRNIPNEATGKADVNSLGNPKTKGVSVRLIPMMGITIPIIVRQGEGTASASISKMILQEDKGRQSSRLMFDLVRQGSRSVYGDLVATFYPHSGAERVVGKIKGVAVYPEVARRHAGLALQEPINRLKDGRLVLTLTQPDAEGGRVLSQAELSRP